MGASEAERWAVEWFADLVRRNLEPLRPRVTLLGRLTPAVHGTDGPGIGVVLRVAPGSAEFERAAAAVHLTRERAFTGATDCSVAVCAEGEDRAATLLRGKEIR